MYKRLQQSFTQDKDFPLRQFVISMRQRVLNGTLYDGLQHAFDQEKSEAGEYIKLRDRRPSVRYGLIKIVVGDSVALLFSEGHFPKIDSGDEENVKKVLDRLIKETNLNQVMIDAATRGSVGSIAILFRVLGNRVFFEVMDTEYLTPVWKKDAPDTLDSVEERYKVKGRALKASGYSIPDTDLDATFWFGRDWTEIDETWYNPVKIDTANPQAPKFTKDEQNSVAHQLGFVPVVWAKNLPGGDDIDGACTFPDEVIDTSIEIDYQLSQAGRGLKYSQDPTLLIKEPAFSDGKIVRSASNAIVVDAEGDAKLLEIEGTAANAVLEYVKALRELALETARGNRVNADKMTSAQSGRAMELMHAPLIRLADQLRISYGEGALLSLLNMIIAASKKIALQFKDGTKVGKIETQSPISLRWGPWFSPTQGDLQQMATTLKSLIDAGILSRQTAVKIIAAAFDIEDAQAEYELAEKERQERDASATKQVTVNE